MQPSGPGPTDPEVPLADAQIAARIARAAATGRGADRAPTLEQLLAAFGEPAPTEAARRRVAAALRVAGLGVRPDVEQAPPGQRLLLLPPGAGSGPRRGRAAAGVAALALVLGAAAVSAAVLGTDDGDRASDHLAETATFTVLTGTTSTTTATTPTTETQAETGTGTTAATTAATETTPTSTTTPATTTPTAEQQAAAERRRQKARDRRAARRKRAATARRAVTVRVDATTRPTFLCVENGEGRQLYGGTLSGKEVFRDKVIKLNIGLASTRVTVNGNAVTLNGSPTGLEISRKGGVRQLPLGKRPCG